MPHIAIEFSDNLCPIVEKNDLMMTIRDAAVETGIFPLGGIRIRLYEVSDFLVADGALDNGFIHIHLRIGAGRDKASKQNAAERIFRATSSFLNNIFDAHPLGLSLELSEIAPDTSFKRNNLHQYVERRAELNEQITQDKI